MCIRDRLYEAKQARSAERTVAVTEMRHGLPGAGSELVRSLSEGRPARWAARSAAGWRGDLHSGPEDYCEMLVMLLFD